MVKYQAFVEAVRDQADLASTDRAQRATVAVLTGLGHCLPLYARRQIAEELPGTLDDAVMTSAEVAPRAGAELVNEVAQRMETTPERARHLTQSVVAGLGVVDAGLLDYLRMRLADDVLEVLDPGGESPRSAESHRPEVPTEMTDDELGKALTRLTDWSGDRTGITRTVSLPRDRVQPLVDRVQREARQLNDRAHIEHTADGVMFLLRTGDPGVVTEPDIRLAERIDAAVRDVGSGGRPS